MGAAVLLRCPEERFTRKSLRLKRAKTIWVLFLGAGLGLFALAGVLTFGLGCDDWQCGLLRFVVLLAASGSAVAAWGTAVMIAYVHRATWPLWFMVTVVGLAAAGFAVTSCGMSSRW
jgi:hypothetical protein